MKKILFFVFLLFEIGYLTGQCTSVQIIQNGLNVSFNQNTEQVIISDIFPCYNTSEELKALECRKKCSFDCVNFCHSKNSTISAVEYCIKHCQRRVNNCLSDCGEIPPSKLAVSYRYAVRLWYTTGFVETYEGAPKERILSNQIIGNAPNNIVVNLENKLPEESLSFCYFTELLIQYDDGSCCYFRDFACFNKG